MDIFLSINNREQVIQLPIVPSELKIPSPENHTKMDTISQGEIKLLGPDGLKEFAISSFFPKRHYPFSRDTKYKGWEYVELIEAWRKRKVPMRIVVTDTPINMAYAIDNFEYGVQDGSGDIYFTLSVSEFPLIKIRSRRAKNGS